MDAGLTALIGAAVGSIATLGSTMLTGRNTARAQVAQWRRQQRRDAYAGYLGALHDRDLAMDAVREALRPDRPDPSEVDARVERFVALARTVHRAAEVVHLEGPAAAVAAADDVARASEELSALVRRMVERARAGDTSGKAADTALAAECEHALYQAVKAFRGTAAAALGHPGADTP
ncbi:proline dehydrogenase [Streptomyces sp. A0592]|uniref:proline dehydrogenase n=1 Tax=Streptomyces TaxID=1883 RepID=UPI00109E856E|nr:proline dehydrogenase [Streptomyces sp. A0592]THA84301.1 proline dehydrogenase [Streptomyces sp. A0592]WSR86609.1 proline dehydrogenase [Streptomyces erythrochromogenes]